MVFVVHNLSVQWIHYAHHLLLTLEFIEVITYKKIIKIPEEEFDDFLTDSPDPAFDIYNCYMGVGNAVNFEYINPEIKKYQTIRERKNDDR